ncbi:uncharacterized protein MONOS_2340 [Monocercomonoides exilis]|uniref:uncharacterized protein n=1 Tax=Monocercomonoides exilis TaxID=2049356 RepID=UPI00355A8EC7|nr:hypothetical protein MONOS_2340 [Monocercomonoides exilis]|eukprot:MONOS_2340.1-p1 / transcript=MONOS_2340.1 / gene=MONOS_2340 / organism=Monocercomonoides_exilis_PA203 / gene_product=unspecified product / transcript_product=unspecified product / location=Mono_scaffold00048:721-3789(-) / protein_length=808 / sequence_SO=supercontig / SO=protein_coding / is_pseudo=false
MGGGCLEMINVECADNDSTVIFSDSPFEIHADGYAYFTNVTLKKITSKRFGVVFIDALIEKVLFQLEMEEVADEMKVSFAANYTRIDNRWDIVGYSNEKKDKFYFTGLFFDPPPSKPDNMTRAFVKNEGKGNGIDVNSPIDSIYDAYEYLEKSGPCFIDIINAVEPIKAEEITFDVRNGITIEGMNENGEENTEVAVDCDVKIEGNLFTCDGDTEFNLDYDRMDITLNASVFAECQTGYAGTLNVKSCNSESTFTVGDGGVSSFTSCSCTNGNSGGIYLAMPNIQSAPQLKWPKDGKNLVFQNCSVTFSDSKKNTGLCICVNDYTLYKDIAESMKTSFAANYTRLDNRWNVLGYDREIDQFFDFTTLFFDAPPQIPENMERAFVKNGGEGNGINVEFAINSIYDAYYYLEKSGKCFIDIVKTLDAIKAEEIKFSTYYGVSIEGVNDNGKGNTEVAINCDVSVSSILFSCQETVEFQYLAFQFSSTEKNWESLISAGSGSISLKISTCRFVRIGSQSQEGMNSNADGDNPLASSLVSVTFGSVEMDTVKCTDETSFVTFSSSPFSFSGAREVSLGNVEISKVNVQNGAAISIRDESDSSSKVSIEGLNVREVKSEKGAAAGLDITLSSEESRVAIGRSSKCSFKSCSAPEGKSGAIFIDMPKAASNLQLPSEHNLEIDSSNTAGSKTTSLFIIAPDFEKFCKQEDAFLFANDYDDSTVGWIEGAIDEESEPEDVYEKNIKGKKKKPIDNPEKDQTKDKKKTSTGVIAIAIVVPIVVVVAVVVIVIVIVVVRKKRSKNEENDEKEQEMKD